jgi:hypothetical protein
MQHGYRTWVLKYIKKGSICAEIGVWEGEFSKLILDKEPSELHLIDPWKYMPEFGDRCYGKRQGTNQEKLDKIYNNVLSKFSNNSAVTIHRFSSTEAATKLPEKHFDFIYIDANHNFEYVLADIVSYLPKLKDDGIMIGDDYIFGRCPNGGAKEAIKRLSALNAIKLINKPEEEGNQWVLQSLKHHNI